MSDINNDTTTLEYSLCFNGINFFFKIRTFQFTLKCTLLTMEITLKSKLIVV